VTDARVHLTGARFWAFFYYSLRLSSIMSLTTQARATCFMRSCAHRGRPSRISPCHATRLYLRQHSKRRRDPFQRHQARSSLWQKRVAQGHVRGTLPVTSYLAPVKSRSGEVLDGLFFGHEERARFNEESARQSGARVRMYSELGTGHDHVPLSASLHGQCRIRPCGGASEMKLEPASGETSSSSMMNRRCECLSQIC